MAAYYNEFDPAAAHILQSMIDNGVIAPGHVDTRSIKEVMPDDLDGYTQCHFFAGGGLWSVAARLAGWPDDRPLWTGSCPCQPFSAAGKGLGTDDPRHLWPDFHRLIRSGRPAVVMGEQVAGKAGYSWFDGVRADLEGEGYASRAVDFPACSVDAPHQRNRLYWVAVSNANDLDGRGQLEQCSGQGSWPREQPARRHDGSPLDHGFGTGLERHAGHGDGSGRAQQGRSVAPSDGAGAAGIPSDAALSVIQGQPPAGHQPNYRAHAGLHADHNLANGSIEPVLSGGPGEARRSEGPDAAEARQVSGRESSYPDGRHRNGTYWSDAEWIACHDGKARRAQSGIRFLVDGLPGRVDLWRVGGNAIVPQAAAEVIGAFLDAERAAA